jgi:hypothetical protein
MNGNDGSRVGMKGEWEREGGNSGLTPTARQEPPTVLQIGATHN